MDSHGNPRTNTCAKSLFAWLDVVYYEQSHPGLYWVWDELWYLRELCSIRQQGVIQTSDLSAFDDKVLAYHGNDR